MKRQKGTAKNSSLKGIREGPKKVTENITRMNLSKERTTREADKGRSETSPLYLTTRTPLRILRRIIVVGS